MSYAHYIFGKPDPADTLSPSDLLVQIQQNLSAIIVVSDTVDNTVDVYAWDNAGALVVANVGVTFNGILAT